MKTPDLVHFLKDKRRHSNQRGAMTQPAPTPAHQWALWLWSGHSVSQGLGPLWTGPSGGPSSASIVWYALSSSGVTEPGRTGQTWQARESETQSMHKRTDPVGPQGQCPGRKGQPVVGPEPCKQAHAHKAPMSRWSCLSIKALQSPLFLLPCVQRGLGLQAQRGKCLDLPK